MKHSNLNSIKELRKLPLFQLGKPANLPTKQGYYFIISKDTSRRRVLYLGFTKNIWQRLAHHEIIGYLRKETDCKFDVHYYLTNNLYAPLYEYEYLARFKPKFNVAYNGKKRTRIRKLIKKKTSITINGSIP